MQSGNDSLSARNVDEMHKLCASMVKLITTKS